MATQPFHILRARRILSEPKASFSERIRALQQLEQGSDPNEWQTVAALLPCTDDMLKAPIQKTLRRLKAAESAFGVLEKSKVDEQLALLALRALRAIKPENGSVSHVLQHPSPSVRQEALLLALACPNLVPDELVARCLDDEHRMVRYFAVQALRSRRVAWVAEALRRRLSVEADPIVRQDLEFVVGAAHLP